MQNNTQKIADNMADNVNSEAIKVGASVPEGVCVYAVGDIHGRARLLEKMHRMIAHDAAGREASRKVLVYLGDYVDRGENSKQVLDILINHPLDGFEAIYLKGNHEYAMLQFLSGYDPGCTWLGWGGGATLQSYGVTPRDWNNGRLDYESLLREFAQRVPKEHIEFCARLKISHIEGGYMFVHAGLRPGVPIKSQRPEDMMMIREEFVESRWKFEKTVVFGHTIFDSPFVENGRIGIDTGAYATGRLTTAVFEKDSVRFLST